MVVPFPLSACFPGAGRSRSAVGFIDWPTVLGGTVKLVCGQPTTRGGLCRKSANPQTGLCHFHGGGLMPCGTVAAYMRHIENGETACDACRKAAAKDSRERAWRTGKNRPMKPARCGTNSGYEKHIRLRTEPCDACREAHAEYQAAWNRGETYSKRHETTKIPDLIFDVLETWDYPMTADVIAAKVCDIRPEMRHESVVRTVWKLAREGLIEPVERLGEKLWRLSDEWEWSA